MAFLLFFHGSSFFFKAFLCYNSFRLLILNGVIILAQSLNTKVDYTGKAIFYLGFAQYGKIMIGDNAFEFFDDRSVEKNSQFPWASIARVEGTVSKSFGGKQQIGRYFSIVLQNGKKVRFSSQEAGTVLKNIRVYLGNEKVVKLPSLATRLKARFSKKK
jgi:hypothetical protein